MPIRWAYVLVYLPHILDIARCKHKHQTNAFVIAHYTMLNNFSITFKNDVGCLQLANHFPLQCNRNLLANRPS